MRYHHQNLTDGRLPLWRYGRAWWGKWNAEWSCFRDPYGLRQVAAFRWGFSLYMPYFGLHISRGERGADWCLSWRDGGLHISHPWVRQMEWRSAGPWWKKDITLPIADWLIGRARIEKIDGERREVIVPMPEGSYRATAQHCVYETRRRWYWPVDRRPSVWLNIPGGIPCSGKGENSWDCGDDGLFGCGGDTEEEAIAHAVRSSLRDRRRQGYDSKGTGRTPAIVLNAGVSP